MTIRGGNVTLSYNIQYSYMGDKFRGGNGVTLVFSGSHYYASPHAGHLRMKLERHSKTHSEEMQPSVAFTMHVNLNVFL